MVPLQPDVVNMLKKQAANKIVLFILKFPKLYFVIFFLPIIHIEE